MRVSCAALAAALLLPTVVPAGRVQASGQSAPAPAAPGPSTPAQGGTREPAPGQTGSARPAPGPTTPGQPAPGQAPAPPLAARTFTAPAGLLFNAVRADRVADFEKVLGYLQTALEQSTDPTIRAQAMSWRMFKAAEPGPGGSVLYVFAFDPTVPGADYGLGRILADAYPDTAQLQEIWRLYQGAVTSGGSLLNLTPVTPEVAPPPPVVPPSTVAPLP